MFGTAVREGKWKLILWDWPQRAELFDLETDPGESKNLATEHPELVTELSKKISRFLSETKAYSAAKNPKFKGEFKKW